MSQALTATRRSMTPPSHRVAEYSQRAAVAAASADVSYGLCVGFSIAWLLRHRYYKAETSLKRMEYMRLSAAFAAERDTRAYLKARTTGDVFLNGQAAAHGAGLRGGGSTASIVKTTQVQLDSADLKEELAEVFAHTSGIHNYFLILLSFGEDRLKLGSDNHTIAAYHSGGTFRGWGSHLYVFEPNFGEFKLSGGEIKGFFREEIAAYRGYVDKQNVASPKIMRMITIHQVHVA